MTDDSSAGLGSSSKAASTGFQSSAPTGHGLRRATTTDESWSQQFKRFPISPSVPRTSTENVFEESRRRGSNFSDYSLNEARRSLHDDLLNPRPTDDGDLGAHEASRLSTLPLAFALLPALGGIFFKNGSAFITDIMLLGLASIFLHWTVTQPWTWYHSAQEVRVVKETELEVAAEYESEGEASQVDEALETSQSKLQDVPEDTEPKATDANRQQENVRDNSRDLFRNAALRELYRHELAALACCFAFPLLGAYLLHNIRSQLSRPSEGLVSNYNISIFILASEVRPLSHLMKMVQSRTLHLQKVVHVNPFKPSRDPTTLLQDLARRLELLEARPEVSAHAHPASEAALRAKQEAAMVREVRNIIQPDLDALNRAVRRYEKKATVLAMQTEARLGLLDARLNDAIALAAAAAKNSSAPTMASWLFESALMVFTMPFRLGMMVAMLPFQAVYSAFSKERKSVPPEKASRRGGSRSSSQARYNGEKHGGDRMSSRLAKR